MTPHTTVTQIAAPVAIKNVLYLTDFSRSSEAALPFALGIASKHAGFIEVLHVLTPVIPDTCLAAIEADEELAAAEMEKIRSRIAGVACQMSMPEGIGIAEAIERSILGNHIDMVVAGTNGRTGVSKLLL